MTYYYGPLSRMSEAIQSPEAIAVLDQYVPGLCGAVTPESNLHPMAIQRIFSAFPDDVKEAFYAALENIRLPN